MVTTSPAGAKTKTKLEWVYFLRSHPRVGQSLGWIAYFLRVLLRGAFNSQSKSVKEEF